MFDSYKLLGALRASSCCPSLFDYHLFRTSPANSGPIAAEIGLRSTNLEEALLLDLTDQRLLSSRSYPLGRLLPLLKQDLWHSAQVEQLTITLLEYS